MALDFTPIFTNNNLGVQALGLNFSQTPESFAFSNPFDFTSNINAVPVFMQKDFYQSMLTFSDFLGGNMPYGQQLRLFDTSFNTKTDLKALKSSYKGDLGNKLANIAYKVATGKNTVGKCYRGVKDSLNSAGLDNGSLAGGSAYMAKDYLGHHKNFTKVDISREDLKKLPAGCVIVWDPYNDKRGNYHQHGHIAITLGNGQEASDHVQNLVMANKYTVFVPSGMSHRA